MGETVRFGVSMDRELIELLDKLAQKENYANRSETIRNLVRKELISAGVEDKEREVIGTVTLLYRYTTHLPRVPVSDYPSLSITANLQLHAEEDIRIKVMVVKGKGKEVSEWAKKLLSCKKIIGKLSFAGTDQILKELI